MRSRPFAGIAITATIFAVVLVAPERADAVTGSYVSTCTVSPAPNPEPSTRTLNYSVTAPAAVDPGEHFAVTVSVDFAVSAVSTIGVMYLPVTGAAPDLWFSDPNSALVSAAPGASEISGTVWFTATGALGTDVQLSIGTIGQATLIGDVMVSETCSGAGVVATIPIGDGPDPPSGGPTVSIGDVAISEGTNGAAHRALVPVTLSEPMAQDQTVEVVIPGSATRTIRFNAGVNGTKVVQWLSIPIVPDLIVESGESIALSLQNPVGGASIGDGNGIVTILDDDTLEGAGLSIGDISLVEGDAGTVKLRVSVTLNAPLASSVTANLDIVSATASCGAIGTGADCRSQATRTLTILPGRTSRTFTVTLYPDGTDETDESFLLSLSNVNAGGSPVQVPRPSATVTILDDDGPLP
jgi:hypothetical protein